MNYRLLLLVAVLFSLTHQNLKAQCIPDITIVTPGIYPDSATGLPSGTVNQAYSEVIQAKVLTDTTYLGLPAIITNITIVGVTGLPPGLTYACNPASCVFPGGSNGCFLLSDTPTVAGAFPINVNLEINGTIFGIPANPISQTLDYYVININTGVGLSDDLSNVKFDLLQNTPNPADTYTDVAFTSPLGGDFTLKIFNMIGKEVYKQTIRGMAGKNTTRIMLDDYAPGVYMLSLENGNTIVTRRMIVSRK
ncbi:MAG TPA: T9SS type A sorting domain-containing protein [Bacteroidia bacterium]|nr:T9SS type A sorting domain-containing protein [Bacteroidia bacterium]